MVAGNLLGGLGVVSGANNTIQNNTFAYNVGNAIGAAPALTALTGLTIRNNLFVGAGGTAVDIATGTAGSVTNNAFSGFDTNVTGMTSTSEITSSLLLSNAYKPKIGSPLLGSGVDLGYLRTLDRRQSRGHIGAFAPAKLRVKVT